MDLKNFLKRFSYDDLKSFTNDFDINIGSGGFGKVYRGEFPNGMQIAVKVLNELYVTEDLFTNEVQIMGMTYHHRLVRFLGYCSDSNKKGLVYEYMENGSLDKILRMKDRPIEWNKLYDITIKTAKGISYLHDKRIIHHDIKPANILLDSEFSPKVADFGLAKLMNKDVTHITAIWGTGTRGYMAPEMAVLPFSHVTHKCDVYSFGMMLFDILGMSSLNQNNKWFLNIVWEGFQNGQLDKIIKDCGIEEKNKGRAKILSKVAFWCTQYTPKTRPAMSEVVKMLKGELPVKTPPNPFLPSSEDTMQPLTEAYEDKVSDKEIEDKILTQPENEENKIQPLTEVYEDKVSDKEIEDKILTQPENEDNKMQLLIEVYEDKVSDKEIADKILTQPENEDNKMQLLTEANEDKVSDKELEDKIFTQPENEELKAIEPQSAAPVINSGTKSSNNLARYDFSLYEGRDDVEAVIEYLMEDHGFSSGIPIAAILIYKCVLKFCSEISQDTGNEELGRLHMLVTSIGYAIKDQYNKDRAPYWLSNTSMLRFLLRHSFKFDDNTAQSWRCPSMKQHVMSLTKKIEEFLMEGYEIVRHHLNEDLRSSLSLCIQAPTTTNWRADWKAYITSSASNSPTSHWRTVISTLNVFLTKLQDNFVPRALASKLFTQVFHDINVQLFNSILTNHECCSLGYGEYVKVGIYELDRWYDLAKNYVAFDYGQDPLRDTRHAIEFLVIVDKSEMTAYVLTSRMSPRLKYSQLYRICRILRDNENNTQSVSSDLVDELKKNIDSDIFDGPDLLEKSRDFFVYMPDYEVFSELEKTNLFNITPNVEIPRNARDVSFEFLNVPMEMYERDASFEF